MNTGREEDGTRSEARTPGREPAPWTWTGLEEFRPMLFRFLMRRCRDENEADDLIQETFLRAARYRRRLSNRARLRSWVVQIAANVFRDHVQRSRRRPVVGCDEELFDSLETTTTQSQKGEPETIDLGGEWMDMEDAIGHMNAALLKLMQRDQAVLASYYGGGENTAHTAVECGISQSLVKVRLFRARRRLERAVRLVASESRARRLVRR